MDLGAAGKDSDLDDRDADGDANDCEIWTQIYVFGRFAAEEPHRCRLYTGGTNSRWWFVVGYLADRTPSPTQ